VSEMLSFSIELDEVVFFGLFREYAKSTPKTTIAIKIAARETLTTFEIPFLLKSNVHSDLEYSRSYVQKLEC